MVAYIKNYCPSEPDIEVIKSSKPNHESYPGPLTPIPNEQSLAIFVDILME